MPVKRNVAPSVASSVATGTTAALLYDPASFAAAAGTGAEADAPDPPTAEELQEFRERVSEWSKLDDQIRKLSVAIRERRVHQKAIGVHIQEFMMRHRYDDLNTRVGRIRHTVRTVPVPLKKADIQQRILDIAGEEAGAELVAKIFDDTDRPKVQKTSLRRIVPKVSLDL